MTAAAFINADILRRLADDARPVPAGDAFAAEFGRDPSNFRKTLKLLENDGLVVRPSGQPAALTDLGRQTLRGIDVAEGREPAPGTAAPDRWPVAAIRPNPTNRQISEQSAISMAGEILGFGDIIQPLTLTPADANGVRMILAGERRWRGATILTGALGEAIQRQVLGDEPVPAALIDGVPFVEREADEATAILITIVENGAREDLSPLEDAEQLLKLAEATNWSGAEIARRTGRLSETKKNGAKDVQDKLKIAREATPEALTEYRRTGSWDDLRNSVRDRRPPEADADADQLPMFEESEAPARHYTVADFGVPRDWRAEDLSQAEDWLEPDTVEILHCQDGRVRATIYVAQLKGGVCWLNGTAHATASSGHSSTMNGVWHGREPAFLTREAAINAASAFILASYGAKMTKRIRDWLDNPTALTGPHVVNGVDYLNASRAQEARYAQGIDKRPQPNSGGRTEAPDDQYREPSPRARVALVELAYKIDSFPELLAPSAMDPAWGDDTFANYRTFGAKVGSYWKDPAFAELDKLGYVSAKHRPGLAPLAHITDQGVAWFAVSLISIPPSAGEVINLRTEAGIPNHSGGASTFVTDWLENEAKAAASPEADPTPQLAGDEWDRDAEQIVADRDLLADALTLYHADDEEPDEDAARDLMQRLGVTAPFGEDGDGSLLAQVGGKCSPIAIVDPDRTMPDDRSRALGLLIVWACRVVFGDDTSSPVTDGPVSAPDNPAVSIRKSITPDFLVCLEDGRKFKSLKRHLRTRYNLSPEEYRERWALPADYPMQAPNYTRARAELAQRMGLAGAAQ